VIAGPAYAQARAHRTAAAVRVSTPSCSKMYC
jgi:hypothetical protein